MRTGTRNRDLRDGLGSRPTQELQCIRLLSLPEFSLQVLPVNDIDCSEGRCFDDCAFCTRRFTRFLGSREARGTSTGGRGAAVWIATIDCGIDCSNDCSSATVSEAIGSALTSLDFFFLPSMPDCFFAREWDTFNAEVCLSVDRENDSLVDFERRYSKNGRKSATRTSRSCVVNDCREYAQCA